MLGGAWGESQNGCFKKSKHSKFCDLPPDAQRTCAYQGLRNFRFLENLACCFLETPVLRFALLPYYRRYQRPLKIVNSLFELLSLYGLRGFFFFFFTQLYRRDCGHLDSFGHFLKVLLRSFRHISQDFSQALELVLGSLGKLMCRFFYFCPFLSPNVNFVSFKSTQNKEGIQQ